MEVEEAIYTRLKATAVWDAVGGRVYPNEAEPDVPRPLVVYAVIGTEEYRELDGTVYKTKHALNVQVESDRLVELKEVSGLINAALDRQRFDGIDRAYRTDYQTGETEDGGYESIQSFNVWQ